MGGIRKHQAAGRYLGGVLLCGALIAVLLAPVLAGADHAAQAAARTVTGALPGEFQNPDPPLRSTVLAADGSVLATFFRQDRVPVALDEVAPVLRQAVLATEDAQFYDHGAIDPSAILRAAATNLAAGEIEEGGSTLTQQYVKRALVAQADTPEEQREAIAPTLERKLQELAYAVQVEEKLSKDEIFSRYLNIVYFGNSAYGIQVAAQRYFGKDAAELTLPEAALLAGLIKAPAGLDPVQNPQRAQDRRGVVLRRMVDAGFITRAESRTADSSPLGISLNPSQPGCEAATYAFFCGYVLAEIQRAESLGATPIARVNRLLEGGLTVRTTLDPKVQQAAVDAVEKHIEYDNAIASAIVMTEPGDGAVRAIAINRRFGDDEGETKVNYALDEDQGGSAGFQAGSTFKPFVLTAALDQGIREGLDLPAPSRITVDGFENCETGEEYPPYTVGNYQDNAYGRIDMAAATQMSVNTYFVQLEERTGICAPPEIAESMGLYRADGEPLSRVPSFVLGVDEVSPLRMAEAYATLAAGGEHCDSYAITAITGPDGAELTPPEHECEQAFSAEVADDVTDMLQSVIDGDNPRRTGAAMDFDGDRDIAGKTGTVNDIRAVWFAGYSADLAAAVWAGYPDGSRSLRNVEIMGETYDALFGGALPGPIWRDAMEAAHEGVPRTPLED